MRGTSIIIEFQYQGQRLREAINVGMPPTDRMVKDATNKRAAILYEIKTGAFDYARHFPESKNAKRFCGLKGDAITIEQALKDWLKRKQRHIAYSTMRGYGSMVYHHLIPSFGHLRLTELTKQDVEHWMRDCTSSNKRINNALTPLRQVYVDAFCEGQIKANPLERVQNLKICTREARPFTLKEIEKIMAQLEGQERNLIQFAFWSGLRTSELLGLKWENIDLPNNRIYVREAVVHGRLKNTKTAASARTVELNPHSREAIENQHSHPQSPDFVFNDPLTGKRWANDGIIRKRVWMPALCAAQISYRSPYHTRHTFASMMLSQGRNPLWVALQMGHKDWGMIRNVYGKWIPS